MWNGKSVDKWTLEEKNHFLTLLMGKCWHDQRPFSYVCHKCSSSKPNIDFYHDLSGFQTVKDFIESQMAETWEKYLRWCYDYSEHEGSIWDLAPVLNAILSLDNLITFLLENQEWAWKECPSCNGKTIVGITTDIYHGGINIYCGYCVAGKVKHPERYKALEFAEGLK
jgi:hypothetical protein